MDMRLHDDPAISDPSDDLRFERDLDAALATMRIEGSRHDHAGADLHALMAPLIDCGLWHRAPAAPYGHGYAVDAAQTEGLFDLLRRVGGADLSAGRLFEGHVNAVKLVANFGNPKQAADIPAAVASGALMGVWNAETGAGLRLVGPPGARQLAGAKIFASGAGLLDRPLITARIEGEGVVMTVPKAAAQAPFDLSGWRMTGMRATATATVDLDGVAVAEDEIIGAPGDYYRAPGFRGGAWRFAAVQFGAVEEIARLMREGLRARGRNADPHQRARAGRVEIAVETARLWVRHAATVVETQPGDAADADACAGMARLVVERAALEVIETAQRALGLAAFAEAEPIERVVRNLSTYLRQPFPDAVLDGIGEWALSR